MKMQYWLQPLRSWSDDKLSCCVWRAPRPIDEWDCAASRLTGQPYCWLHYCCSLFPIQRSLNLHEIAKKKPRLHDLLLLLQPNVAVEADWASSSWAWICAQIHWLDRACRFWFLIGIVNNVKVRTNDNPSIEKQHDFPSMNSRSRAFQRGTSTVVQEIIISIDLRSR